MPNNKSNYHIYTHNDPSINTMGSFVSNGLSIGIGLDIVKFLNYEDELGTKNVDNLTSLYSFDELRTNKVLIDQLKSLSQRQQVESRTLVNSSVNGNSLPITVDNSLQPNSFIILKKPDELSKAIAGVESYSNRLDANQVSFIDKVSLLDVRKLLKKFIFRVANETNYTVVLTSTYRPPSNKENAYNDHMAGLAWDLNLKNKTTGELELKQPISTFYGGHKQFTLAERVAFTKQWKDTGVIKIAKELNIVWGGDFKSTYFDPIHFQATYYYQVDHDGFYRAITANNNNNPESQTLSEETIEEVSQNDVYSDLPLKVGTVFNLPLVDIDREILVTETNQAINTAEFGSFLAKELYFLLSDQKYEREFIPKNKAIGQVKEIFPYISVWVWSRALSLNDDGSYDHTILNVTKYISSINTNVGSNGGSFSFDLAAVEGELSDGSWEITKQTQKASTSNSGEYVNHSFLHYEQNDELKRSPFFFEKVLQQNDLVFIRFERLLLEDNRQNLDALESVSINQLPNQIFDMIGLIDTSIIGTQPENASVTINISGRDLVKLIIEDGIYFYPYDFVGGGIFANETGAANQRLNRYNGQILNRFQTQNKTIDRILKYIINALSSIDICPTDLFVGYASGIDRGTGSTIDKRSKAYKLDNSVRSDLQDRQRKVDSDKSAVLSKINKVRQDNNITESSATAVFQIIESFLQDRINNGEIEDKLNNILSWTEVIDNVVFKDRQPTALRDLLFIRDRAWIDGLNRPIAILVDIVSKDIVRSIESLFNEVDKNEVRKQKSLIFSQLLRKDRINIPILTRREIFNLKDLITELKSQLDTGNIIDGVSYSSSFSKLLLGTTSPTQIPFKDDLDIIDVKYSTVLRLGRTINLAIINSQLNDFSIEVREIFNSIYKIIKEEAELLRQQQGNQALLPVNGIWQIIKLVVDDSVKNRLLADPSIGNEHGSLINAIRKICQEPFCEFFTDTYGDQFYFIVRKKPFDKEGVLSMLEKRVIYEKTDLISNNSTTEAAKIGDLSKLSNSGNLFISPLQKFTNESLIISIDESDVLSDNLRFSQEAYSWYRLQLKNLISGNDSDLAFAYLKAVYFNEFADMFGSKPLDVCTNYIPYQNIVGKNESVSTAFFIRQGIYDLKYLIESNAYLPFTREGTIVINGDRTIKRGTFVRLKSTNEIFYVDSISHSFSINDSTIDRTTTLTVSRGMVEKYIKGVDTETSNGNVNISYFNICNLPIDESVFSSRQNGQSDFNRLVLSRWKVNPVVFNFFIKRFQFNKNNS